MKWIWRVVALVAFLAMLYSCALPGKLAVGRDEATGLAGTYSINGVDPSGLEYSGTVVIANTDTSDIFNMEWIVTGQIVRGTATRNGSTLDVVWETIAGVGDASGTASYEISEDGRLIGERTATGFETPGTEEIFPEP